jgi:hypothetical protein
MRIGFGKGIMASLAGGLLLMGAAQSASANSITVTIGTPTITNLGGGTFAWDYGATLSAGSEIDNGSFFEIVDFGTVLGVTPNTNWTASVQQLSQVSGANIQLSFNSLPADTALDNVLFQYNGPQIGSATTPTDLGTFRIIGPEGSIRDGAIIGNDYQFVSGSGLGRSQTNFGPTAVPAPLPAAAWGGVALLGLLGAKRVRKSMK